jgi:hypothetical protein
MKHPIKMVMLSVVVMAFTRVMDLKSLTLKPEAKNYIAPPSVTTKKSFKMLTPGLHRRPEVCPVQR